ncbi:MAG: nuclear transport factor 2 family protein [Acidimicrobiales bacterium]
MTDGNRRDSPRHEKALEPDDLGRLFLQRANGGDIEGVVALYEREAVLESPASRLTTGLDAIRALYEQLFASRPSFAGDVRPAIRVGELALTSTQFDVVSTNTDGRPIMTRTATVEIARRQSDGSWLWVIDKPNVLSR